jgi:hypothetical protein
MIKSIVSGKRTTVFNRMAATTAKPASIVTTLKYVYSTSTNISSNDNYERNELLRMIIEVSIRHHINWFPTYPL